MTDRTCLDAAALWDFSTAFYDRPGVAEALLTLQDRDGHDVNLVLFALWLGASGRPRLTPAALKAAKAEILPLHRELVEPLRTLRRKLKLSADTDLVRLRGDVGRLELAAEKAVQGRLAAYARPVGETKPAERRATARANLELYLGRKTAEASIVGDALDAFLRER